LLASFQNHLSDAVDRARRLTRGGDKEAMTLLAETLNRLRKEYASERNTSTFEALRVFLDPNSIIAPPTYEQLANRLRLRTGGVDTPVSDQAEIDEKNRALCETLIASEGRLSP
jgi:hypothetical protein